MTQLLYFEMQIYCGHLKRQGLTAQEIAIITDQPVDKIWRYLQRYRKRVQPAEFYEALKYFNLDDFYDRLKRFRKGTIKKTKKNEYD